LGLLRSAPDLLPSIKNVKAMYQDPEEGADELVPVDGKDEVYDTIMAEIAELEHDLNEQLKKFEKSLGYAFVTLDNVITTIANSDFQMFVKLLAQRNRQQGAFILPCC
jgi:DNA mismatch repair protein MSH6